ncbi:MAG: GAF domain-containing protein, partial [Gammaproteobacteria bacterium]|nr:GAF domain-containing protein [Gammaproteobacteria bacterium]
YYVLNAMLFPRSVLAHTLYQEAASLLENSRISEESASFYFAGTVLHAAWHQPWSELVSNFNQGGRICEKIGNLEFLALSALYQIVYDTPLPIETVLKKLSDLRGHVQDASQRVVMLLDVMNRAYLNLSGGCDFNSWQDGSFNAEKLLQFFQEQTYQLGIYMMYLHRLQNTIQLDDSVSLKVDTENLDSILSLLIRGNAAKTILPAYLYLFIAKVLLYPTLSRFQKTKTRLELEKLHRAVKSWVKFCPENFAECEVLMRAELAGLKGNLKKALKLYDEAIELAVQYKLPEYACLAAQRALKLCVAANQPELTYQYANKAVALYADWGAFGVVKMLQEKYAAYLTPESKVLSAHKELSKEDYNARYGLDARSIMLAARAINKELQLGGLLRNTMQLLVENIAATRAALCLMLKGVFWVEAYYDNEEKEIQTLTHTPWEEARISQEAFLQTWREKKEVLVMDVSKSEFQGSAYLQSSGAKSLISVPIFNADGDEVVGVIYCENKLSTDSFTADRLMVLRALSIQMSLSIDNSRLYTLFERFVPKPFLKQLGQEDIFNLDAGDSVKKDMNVLFMDIRNFTGFSEKNSSDQTFQFINDYLAEVTPVIHSHHGFIDKFLGDGIMALFPGESREALAACILMQQKIADFARTKHNMQLKVGMGLHCGPLMLGIVGEDQHIEGTVIGDTVNVASRLEALNKTFKTQCLLSDAIKNTLLASEHYHLRPVGKIRLLGRTEAMTVWQLLDNIAEPALRDLHIQQLPLFERCYAAYLQRDFETAQRGFADLFKDNPKDGVLAFYAESSRHFAQNPPPTAWQAEIDMQF